MELFGLFLRDPLLAATVLAVGAVIFVNGWTDAPTAISSCVAAGVMSARRAVLMSAVCNLLGIAVSSALSPAVATTVLSLVRLPDGAPVLSLSVLLCAMAATAVWAVAAWAFGLPTSESHALLAGLSGAAVAYGGAACVNGTAWLRVGAGLLISLAGGFALGFAAFVLTDCATQKRGGEAAMGRSIAVGAAAMSFMHGAQDGQKFMGIWLLALSLGGGTGGPWVAPTCAALMGLGTLLGGGRILRTLGEGLVKTGRREGFAADIAAAVCLLLLTLGGIPVSTTHTKTAAIMGVGAAKWRGGSKRATALKLFAVWLLTFPACFLLAYVGMKWILIWLGNGI